MSLRGNYIHMEIVTFTSKQKNAWPYDENTIQTKIVDVRSRAFSLRVSRPKKRKKKIICRGLKLFRDDNGLSARKNELHDVVSTKMITYIAVSVCLHRHCRP